jgi:hypothetical protein
MQILDQVLWQRVCSEGLGWLKETPIAFLHSTGRFLGSWTGTPFTGEHYLVNVSFSDKFTLFPNQDDTTDADKVIRRVRIRSGWYIDGISLEFTDGKSTGWHGGYGGNSSTFSLEKGEDFSSIRVAATSDHITGLQFITSKGRYASTITSSSVSQINLS